MTEPQVATTVPFFRVAGRMAPALTRDVSWLEVEHTTQGLKTLRARFLAFGRPEGDGDDRQIHLDGEVDFGASFEVFLGPDGADRRVFRGRVSAVEFAAEEGGPSEVIVHAEDRLMDLRMTRRCRTWRDADAGEIARGIAAEHGMAADVDVDAPAWDVVQQFNQSDLAFLRERARLVQAELWEEDDTLYFKQRPRRAGPEHTLTLGAELLSLRARADLAHQRTSVRVTGYDARHREAIDEEAGESAVRGESPAGRTGPAVLASAFGERPSHRAREAPLTPGEARSLAGAEMLRRARSFVVADGVTSGTADMVVGSRLTLLATAPSFDGGGYYVTRVIQRFDLDRGFRTRFEAERATLSEGP